MHIVNKDKTPVEEMSYTQMMDERAAIQESIERSENNPDVNFGSGATLSDAWTDRLNELEDAINSATTRGATGDAQETLRNTMEDRGLTESGVTLSGNVPVYDSSIRGTVMDQLQTPTLAPGTEQTFTPITQGEGEAMTGEGSMIEPIQGITASGMGDSAAAATPGDIATAQIDPNLLDQSQVPVLNPETGQISYVAKSSGIGAQAIEAAQGTLSDEALAQESGITAGEIEAAQGEASPKDMMKAAVGTVDSDALVKAAKGSIDDVVSQIGNMSTDVQAAVAELPPEALVSTQLDALLEGLNEDEIPVWARPAVDQVDAMLASRGLSKSTIAREQLFNAIIQSAMPLAQDNALAIRERANLNLQHQQQAYMQQSTLDGRLAEVSATFAANMGLANLNNAQEAAIKNADANLQMDLTNLNNQQQAVLVNSQFMQSLTLENLNNRQQAVIQESLNTLAADEATLQAQTQTRIANARSFLEMDMTNLSNQQQTNLQNAANALVADQASLDAIMKAEQINAQSFLEMDLTNLTNKQQSAIINQKSRMDAMLSNQSIINASLQFNAESQNQMAQFIQQLATTVEMDNAARSDAVRQFNATQDFDAQSFNSQLQYNRAQFNASQSAAIEQSNVEWRRNMNQINTSGINTVQQANATNMFNLSNQALTYLWQEQRDNLYWAWMSSENQEERVTKMSMAALSSEAAEDKIDQEYFETLGAFGATLIGGML